MDGDELRRITRHHRLLQRINTDSRFPPGNQWGDNLRFLAVTMAWVLCFQRSDDLWANVTGLMHLNNHRLRALIAQDVPRYEPLERRGGGCAAPMMRRDGPCGHRPTVVTFRVTNPVDGTWEIVSFCRRHEEVSQRVHAAERARIAAGVPVPPPNAGGLLPGYFPRSGRYWEQDYAWARPGWEPPEAGIIADLWPVSPPAAPVSAAPPPELRVITSGTVMPAAGPPTGPRSLWLVPNSGDQDRNE